MQRVPTPIQPVRPHWPFPAQLPPGPHKGKPAPLHDIPDNPAPF